MTEELLRRLAALEARVHAGGAASRRLVELEEDVHRYYSAFLELDAVLGRMADAQRGLAAGVEALQAQQAREARDAGRAAREAAREEARARRAAREAERAARAALPGALEARLAGFEARLAGLEARGALGARRLGELEDTMDGYYQVFLEVDTVVERVVASQHALVESVRALRAGAGAGAGAGGLAVPPAAGAGPAGLAGPAAAGAGPAEVAGPSSGGRDASKQTWRGKMCPHHRRAYRCKICLESK